jgi:hypothetical protein
VEDLRQLALQTLSLTEMETCIVNDQNLSEWCQIVRNNIESKLNGSQTQFVGGRND